KNCSQETVSQNEAVFLCPSRRLPFYFRSIFPFIRSLYDPEHLFQFFGIIRLHFAAKNQAHLPAAKSAVITVNILGCFRLKARRRCRPAVTIQRHKRIIGSIAPVFLLGYQVLTPYI